MQFQCLAAQHTMAALIGGTTIHGWGKIPVNATDAANKCAGKATEGDVDTLFLNALGTRWLIIDECSSASPELLGLLDAFLRRACARHPHSRRGSHRRPFGGLNIIFAGDLWQLPPVRSNAIFSNPFKGGYTYNEQQILKMFWQKSEDSIQRTFLLTQSLRTTDPWLQAVLEADRKGEEGWEMYCFTHGLPTRNPGSWLPGTALPQCGNARCQEVASKNWPEMWERSRGEKWALRANMECACCAEERKRRCVIIDRDGPNATRYQEEPFTDAPYVHPFRHPSYHAQHLRALNFAKAKNRRLLWLTAHDELKQGVHKRQPLQEEQRRERWFEFHERFTSGIPGLLPLVLDLPVRFTDTPNPSAKSIAMGVFKNGRGWLRGWELPEQNSQRLEEVAAAEFVLRSKPLALYIEVESATALMPEVNGKRIFKLNCRRSNGAWIRRTM